MTSYGLVSILVKPLMILQKVTMLISKLKNIYKYFNLIFQSLLKLKKFKNYTFNTFLLKFIILFSYHILFKKIINFFIGFINA
jgi:hypothetical protein